MPTEKKVEEKRYVSDTAEITIKKRLSLDIQPDTLHGAAPCGLCGTEVEISNFDPGLKPICDECRGKVTRGEI